MRVSRGAIIASWKLYPIPRYGWVKYLTCQQFLVARTWALLLINFKHVCVFPNILFWVWWRVLRKNRGLTHRASNQFICLSIFVVRVKGYVPITMLWQVHRWITTSQVRGTEERRISADVSSVRSSPSSVVIWKSRCPWTLEPPWWCTHSRPR